MMALQPVSQPRPTEPTSQSSDRVDSAALPRGRLVAVALDSHRAATAALGALATGLGPPSPGAAQPGPAVLTRQATSSAGSHVFSAGEDASVLGGGEGP